MSLGQSATPLGKVTGLGSAHEGGEHWLAERVSSAALLLLGSVADRVLAVPAVARPARRSPNGWPPRAARCRWRCS